MTNYAEPATPDVALDRAAVDLRHRAERHRRDAAVLLARADEVDEVSRDLEAEARRYRQWQPQPGEDDPDDLDPAT